MRTRTPFDLTSERINLGRFEEQLSLVIQEKGNKAKSGEGGKEKKKDSMKEGCREGGRESRNFLINCLSQALR